MTRFSDAATLSGDFAKMADKLDWSKVEPDSDSEFSAKEIGKQISMLAASIDPEKEKLHVTTMTAQGPMIVMGLFPSDGDILRLEGISPEGQPLAHIIDVDNLALTISRHPIDDKKDDDGLKIGFVIFDELDARTTEKAAIKKAKKSKKLSKNKKA